MTTKRNSLSVSKVLMLSFWKSTPTPWSRSSWVYWMLSKVEREKREISLVMMKSKRPALASRSIRRKLSRRLVVVPDRPSSMYPGIKVQLGWLWISSV